MISNLLQSKKLLVFLGLLLGAFSVFLFPTFIVLCLCFLIIFMFRNNALTQKEKKFISYACILAMGIHITVSLILFVLGHYVGLGSDAIGDARTYEAVGAYIKELATGIPITGGLWDGNLVIVEWLRKTWRGIDALLGGLYTIPFISYWYAYCYTLLGLDYLAFKILNGLLWIISAFWLYLFFRERFTERGIKFGLIAILFLPSGLIFSSSGLKDSFLFFLMMTIIYSVHTLERNKHNRYAMFILLVTPILYKLFNFLGIPAISFYLISLFIISFIIAILYRNLWISWGLLIIIGYSLLDPLRNYASLLTLIFGFSILLSSKINFKKIISLLPVVAIFALAIFALGFQHRIYSRIKIETRKIIAMTVLQSYNTSYAKTPFHIFPEKYYADINSRYSITFPEVLVSYLNGLRYVFLEPTPWAFKHLPTLAMFPETLFMWFLIPFMILGCIIIFRINTRMAIATSLYLFTTTLILALGQGNMGTLARTRWMIMPFYFMLGGIGLSAAYSYFLSQRNKE